MTNVNLIRSTSGAFVKERETDNERLKLGFAIFREALEQTTKESQASCGTTQGLDHTSH